jgi:hypothetical protein
MLFGTIQRRICLENHASEFVWRENHNAAIPSTRCLHCSFGLFRFSSITKELSHHEFLQILYISRENGVSTPCRIQCLKGFWRSVFFVSKHVGSLGRFACLLAASERESLSSSIGSSIHPRGLTISPLFSRLVSDNIMSLMFLQLAEVNTPILF